MMSGGSDTFRYMLGTSRSRVIGIAADKQAVARTTPAPLLSNHRPGPTLSKTSPFGVSPNLETTRLASMPDLLLGLGPQTAGLPPSGWARGRHPPTIKHWC